MVRHTSPADIPRPPNPSDHRLGRKKTAPDRLSRRARMTRQQARKGLPDYCRRCGEGATEGPRRGEGRRQERDTAGGTEPEEEERCSRSSERRLSCSNRARRRPRAHRKYRGTHGEKYRALLPTWSAHVGHDPSGQRRSQTPRLRRFMRGERPSLSAFRQNAAKLTTLSVYSMAKAGFPASMKLRDFPHQP